MISDILFYATITFYILHRFLRSALCASIELLDPNGIDRQNSFQLLLQLLKILYTRETNAVIQFNKSKKQMQNIFCTTLL